MKIFNYALSRIYLPVLLFAGSVVSGCDKDDNAAAVQTLDEQIAANTDLSLFQAALKKTRLTSFTQGGGPFTIFAPTNAAFTKAGIANEAALNALDTNYLVQLLTYHIQANARTYVEIPLGPNATMTTQSGFTLYASRYIGGNAYINGAQITSPDIKASNGVMHIINNLLLPPLNNAFINMAANPDYSLMVQAITKTASTASFNAGTVTVFAVPNSVMTAAGYDAAAIAGLTGAPLTLLGNIMKYHVVTQRIFLSDFKTGSLKTVQASNVIISVTGTTINVKGIANPAPFQVTSTGLTSSNGVLYSINGLLKY